MYRRFLEKHRHASPLFPTLALCFLWMILGYPSIAHAKQDVTVQWSKQDTPAQVIARDNPFIGVHGKTLIVAGGENINSDSRYLDSIWLADRNRSNPKSLSWKEASTKLPIPRAHGASTSFAGGLVLVGGITASHMLNEVLLIRTRSSLNDIELLTLPSLPIPMAQGSVVIINNILYVLVTQTNNEQSPTLYSLDLKLDAAKPSAYKAQSKNIVNTPNKETNWQQIPINPSAQLLVSQNDGKQKTLFAVANSRTKTGSDSTDTPNLGQLWQYQANNEQIPWLSLSAPALQSMSKPVLNSTIAIGQSHFLLFSSTQDTPHVLGYNAITDAWAEYKNKGLISEHILMSEPLKHRTLQAIAWGNDIVVFKNGHGEQTNSIWFAKMAAAGSTFGWQNMTVLIVYLLAMVMVGVYFVFKNKSVNDYFRGGQHIPWWANACSMYATMLSSLTFVGIPAIVYRTDWLYWMGIWMILAVTPIAAYVAMPFFRKIDATSAYEFLSLRFNMSVRLFASGLFTLFHVSRMGIVMALTALALGAVTPFDVWQCVLIIGLLSLIYCTLGGIEAVIWTDTIQTIVLLLGAILCFAYIVNGVDGGISEIFRVGLDNDKFRMVDIDFSMDSFTKLSLWVIVLGGIGQNLSTYTADQSIVQRYMTTKDVKSARKSIWTNGIMAPIASALFFAIGTGLFVFYQYNPERLDPTKQIDQIFPSFISTELPIGIAGLIIAGIFAAAQSTVSTSMNSMATTVVTDFMRPFNVCKSERAYLNAARIVTLLAGIVGTLVGLLFISPEIRSLMEEYFKVVGMFMGALGGLFILGVVSTRANAAGAIIGLLFGVSAMLVAWIFKLSDGYLFGTIGIVSSILVGYFASMLFKNGANKELSGLTIHTIK